ncbi:MAG: cytochrome c oxidase subunit 3 [Acetobacteraceae bacterium]
MSVAPKAMHDALREPWHSLHRQREGVSLGVWVFLGSEVMFFGGAFLLYAMYRVLYPAAFAEASHEASMMYGSINTALLLTSSLTMTVATEGARAGLRRLALICLLVTVFLGLAFLVVKGLEYREDIHKNLIPGPHFGMDNPAAQLFWAFYWLLTGVHAVHLSGGILFASLMTFEAWRGTRPLVSPGFEALGLYWSFVDLVWIFLYAVIYLPGRSL